MKLSKYEREAITCLIKGHKGYEAVVRELPTCAVNGYEFTGGGYFLQLKGKGWNLEKETIHTPLVTGKSQNIEIGFLLYTDTEILTLECHSWGADNLPENIRQLNFEIAVVESR